MEPLRQQVIGTQRKVNDLLDKPNDPAAVRLRAEIQGLEDDIQSGKNVYSVEDRIKRIVGILGGEAKTAQIMNPEHLDMFRHWFEQLRTSVQQMR